MILRHTRVVPVRGNGLMAEIRQLAYAQVPASVELLARGMRDDPMNETVFGPDT
jgi:hypothetical protein